MRTRGVDKISVRVCSPGAPARRFSRQLEARRYSGRRTCHQRIRFDLNFKDGQWQEMLKWSAATASRDALGTFAQGEAAGRKHGHGGRNIALMLMGSRCRGST